ncbi:class I tRNA ligase family protein [Candidatus Parcubacteria bacterium]|nr:class I tRNA ligase family protein [Candidatus Parcubacteria bacterium]
MKSAEAAKAIAASMNATWKTTYKLRDWIFSRQRYWGEPIPMIHCENCGWVSVPEKDLPVKLPVIKNYKPTDSGESPLASATKWVNVKCPQCKGSARRETDTMPNWAGSSWYYLRYTDPKNGKAFADPKKLKYWTPVDWYNGGMEHTTLHLLYSRFWHKFLYDQKLVPTLEPYAKRTSHGLILAEDGEKMSKSKGNVINPDDIVKIYGADSLRLYEMFMGPFDQAISWSSENIIGVRRFLERVWRLFDHVEKKAAENTELGAALERLVKKVTDDIESMKFNTAISAMMVWINEAEKNEKIATKHYEKFLVLLAPFAPHMTEELWNALGHKISIQTEKWPRFDLKLMHEQNVTFAVQVNGKVRATFEAEPNITENDARQKALSLAVITKWIDGKTIKKIIFVPKKIVNIVV